MSLGPISSIIGQLILDVRSISHDAGTDNDSATFADPKVTYIKVLVTSDQLFRGREHVKSHFLARLTIVFRTDFVTQKKIN